MPALPIALAIIMAVGFVGVLLALGRGGKPFQDSGSAFTLKHSALLRWFSIAAVFGGTAGFGLSTAIIPPQYPLITWLNVLGVTVLGTFGMALLWESFRWSLTVKPSHLECSSPWKPKRIASWNDVKSVTYSKLNSWYVIRFQDGGSFRVPGVVPGVMRFVEASKRAAVG